MLHFVSLCTFPDRTSHTLAMDKPVMRQYGCNYNEGREEGNVLFNDALNTFLIWLYDIQHMVKDHSDSERGKLLLPHGLLFPYSSKRSFICTIPQTG